VEEVLLLNKFLPCGFFYLSSFLFPRLISADADWMHTILQLCGAISSQLRHISTIGKNLLSSNTSSTCAHNMVNFGPLLAEICSLVWGTPANFKWFRVLAELLHGTLVVGVSQNLRR